MAEWIDTGDGYARAPNGQEVPIGLLPPGERVVPAAAAPAPLATPVAPGGDMPIAPAAPAAPLTPAAQAVVSKLDNPAIAAARGQPSSRLPIAQQSTTTQSAVPMSVLKPVMDRGMARAETQANAAIQAGEERARIGEQQAMTAATAAYGQQQQSQAEAEQARQRAEIARLNQIAIAAQEDQSIRPDLFVRSMSTGQSIGTVILAAIEGAFRGMTGQPGQSGVLNILERRIDQDIAAQKEQIASGRIRRGNMIQYFREQGMNEEAAEKSARAMALAQAEKLTQAEIARQGAGYAREEGKALAEQIKAAREQANDELMLTLGTPRSTTTTVRQAASGGDTFGAYLQKRKAYEESGATPAQLAKFDDDFGAGAMAPRGESAVARDRRMADEKAATGTELKQKRDAGIKLLNNMAVQLEALPDKVYNRASETAVARGARGVADFVFGAGAGEATLSDQEKSDAQTFNLARENYLAQLSVLNQQGAMTDREREAKVEAAMAFDSPKQLAQAIRVSLAQFGDAKLQPITIEDR